MSVLLSQLTAKKDGLAEVSIFRGANNAGKFCNRSTHCAHFTCGPWRWRQARAARDPGRASCPCCEARIRALVARRTSSLSFFFLLPCSHTGRQKPCVGKIRHSRPRTSRGSAHCPSRALMGERLTQNTVGKRERSPESAHKSVSRPHSKKGGGSNWPDIGRHQLKKSHKARHPGVGKCHVSAAPNYC